MIELINKLLNKKKKPLIDVKTAPLSEEQLDTVSRQQVKLEPSQIIAGVGQSVGKQRDHNDDTLFMMNAMLANGVDNIPFAIFVVADGMGGYQHGDIASMVATRVTTNALLRKIYLPFFSPNPEPQSESIQEIMRAAVMEAHQAVVKAAPGGGRAARAAAIERRHWAGASWR